VDISAATANTNYFRVIMPISGQENDGTALTGPRFNWTTNDLSNLSWAFTMTGENAPGFYGVSITSTNQNTADNIGNIFINGCPNAKVISCIGNGGTNIGSGAYSGLHVYSMGGGNAYIVNTIIYKTEYGFICNPVGGTGYFYNCDTISCTQVGFYLASGVGVSKNCISESNGTNWFGAWTKTNFTDGGGVVFLDALNDNYHLDPTDTIARGQGSDLSSDLSYPFNDTIEKILRTAPWDIGATQDASSPPVTEIKQLYFYFM